MDEGLEALEILKFKMADDRFFQKHELYLPKYENDYNEILKEIEEDEDYQTVEKELRDYKRLIEIINKYIKLDDNYDEIGSGSTKAFKVCIPNCISVEEDDDYTDDCYPNSDYDFINDLLKGAL